MDEYSTVDKNSKNKKNDKNNIIIPEDPSYTT